MKHALNRISKHLEISYIEAQYIENTLLAEQIHTCILLNKQILDAVELCEKIFRS